MTLKEIQSRIDRLKSGAWLATRNKTGVVLRRCDSVELVSVADLIALAVALPEFDTYASIEPRTEWPEDGSLHGVWLMPRDLPSRSDGIREAIARLNAAIEQARMPTRKPSKSQTRRSERTKPRAVIPRRGRRAL